MPWGKYNADQTDFGRVMLLAEPLAIRPKLSPGNEGRYHVGIGVL